MSAITQDGHALLHTAERVFEEISARRLVRALTGWLPHAAWWLRSLIFSAGVLVVLLIASVVLREPAVLRGVHIWAASLLFAALVIYDWLAKRILEIMHEDIAHHLREAAVVQALQVAEKSPILRWQTVLSAFVGALTALLLGPALISVVGVITPATFIMVIFGSALTTNLVYIPASATLFTLIFLSTEVELYPLEPAHSRVVRGLEAIGQHTVWAMAALATVGVLGPFLIPGIGIVGIALAVLVFSGAVLATGAQYLIQQIALSRMIAKRREETLNTLQLEIQPLYERRAHLPAEEYGHLQSLLVMHSHAVESRASALTVTDTLGFVSPLLVPLITLVLSSMQVPVGGELIEVALNFLFK